MMTMMEEMAIVAQKAQVEFSVWLMRGCLALLAAIFAGWFLAWFARTMTPVVVWVKRHGCQAAFVAPLVLCMVYVGSTKNAGRVEFPYTDPEKRYLYDDGSYVTNDYVHVAFTRSAVVPDTADLLGYVRPAGSTNDEDWVQMLDTTFAAFHSPSNIPYAGAISNVFQYFTTFTPGPVVHTNGVAVVNWQIGWSLASNEVATIRTGIYTNAVRLAPNPGITNGPPVTLTLTGLNGGNDDD